MNYDVYIVLIAVSDTDVNECLLSLIHSKLFP